MNGYLGQYAGLRASLYLQLAPAKYLADVQRNAALTSEKSTLGLTQVVTRKLIQDLRVADLVPASAPASVPSSRRKRKAATEETEEEEKKVERGTKGTVYFFFCPLSTYLSIVDLIYSTVHTMNSRKFC